MHELIETEIGLMPKHWKVIPFNQALKVKGRVGWKGYKTSDLRNDGPVVVGGTNIKANLYLDFSQTTYLSREKFEESPEIMLQKGDVILVTRGNGIGDVGYYDGQFSEATINPSLVILTRFIGNPKYLFYYLNSPQGRFQVLSIEGGTSIPALYQGYINTLLCPIPPDVEQEIIVDILSSIDEKINLLIRQNKTLEQLAETLFRQWFVEDNENLKPLGELARVTTGKGLKRDEFIDNGTYPILGANGEIGKTNKYLTDERLIITGRVGTLGEVKIIDDKVWISDNVLIINPTEARFFYPIYFTLKKFDFENINAGSTQPLVTQTDLKNIDIYFGELENLSEFQTFCKDQFKKIKSNTQQIRTLTQLRDTLLPKLMSGEVSVENINL